MTVATELKQLRKLERIRLIAQRVTVTGADRAQWNKAITRHLIDQFPLPQRQVIGCYWPFRGEFDPRFAMHYLQSRGAKLALPRVAQRNMPLQFRQWWPGAPMSVDLFDLPSPDNTPIVTPQALIIPVVGIDSNGFRLGYGSGYFDRTLAVMAPPPLKIAVGYELSRVATIHPQAHDIAMDFLVTEAGVQCFSRADLLDDDRDEPHQYASSPCYAHQFK